MGRAGSGKSTFACRLGDVLGLPVVHLDGLFWNANWQPVGWTTFGVLEDVETAAEAWIIDGNYMSSPGFARRIGRAQLVAVVEAPLILCLWRVIRRSLTQRGRRRRDLPPGADERLSLGFLRWVLRWGRRHPRFPQELRELTTAPVVVVRSDADIERLLTQISSSEDRGRPPAG